MTQVSNSLIGLNLYKAMKDSVRLSFDNQTLMRAAQQADVAKTRFLASASHDLRQPLHALGLFIAALTRKVRGPENNALLDQIDGSLNNVNTMLGTLLDVSRLDAGVVKVKLGNVQLQALFDRLEQEFLPLAQENGNRLRFRPSTLYLSTDAGLFERILRNLISNALRYTHNGQVLVAARKRGQRAVCGIYDNGPGISPEQQLVIFDEFHQLANPERDRRQGLGLGLAIVRRTADLLEHPLELKSNVGRGACFLIAVPIAATATPVAAVDSSDVDVDLAGLSALIVDDDRVVVQAMTTLLQSWGCRVSSCESLDGALALVAQPQGIPDVMLVDYRLRNEVTGDQVISAIHASLGEPIPAIIITGDTAPERIREATAAGFPLLHKPVRPANLRGTVSALLMRSDKASASMEYRSALLSND
jgi:CheY-like chemotaxis protein/nitrogen-specific signal transduction histidine kinase